MDLLFPAAAAGVACNCVPCCGPNAAGLVAAAVPSHAVVSAIKLPFLSWHLNSASATNPATEKATTSPSSPSTQTWDTRRKPTCGTIAAPASTARDCRPAPGAARCTRTARAQTARSPWPGLCGARPLSFGLCRRRLAERRRTIAAAGSLGRAAPFGCSGEVLRVRRDCGG